MSLLRIARSLGLSVTTVSRALGGYEDVAEATRARVQAEAGRIGYRPNKIARRLQSGRSDAIGLVLPAAPGQFDDPFFLRLTAAIGPRLAAAELDLLVMAAPPGPEEMRAYRHLVEGRLVDGMLVARTRRHDERIAYLLNRGLPFVAHGRTQDPRPYAWVDTDGAAAIAMATQRLIELGHRRIGLLNAPPSYNYAQDREAGWRHALAEAGLAEGPSAAAAPTEEAGEAAARALLAKPDPPTGLICATDRLAVGAMRAAVACGRHVGCDLSIIGYDNLPFAAYVHPPLTTIDQPVELAGAHMVDMLLKLLAGADPAGLHAIIPTRLVLRASEGPAPTEAPDPSQQQDSPGGPHEPSRLLHP
ncbi:MAG: substrate-binding domain-containing protein [Rhodospirillales bacterium]|nr:substrate-binding domain-containing protein [Rhodospirillales bacterium]MDE2573856.1 substrate-binding domain-containing protein [Rhodospirillales bacterium]